MNAIYIDLLKWGLEAGADAIAARRILKANGVDPAEYERVIADTRTFRDFHGTNPLEHPADVGPGSEVPPNQNAYQANTILNFRPTPDQIGTGKLWTDDQGHWYVMAGFGVDLGPAWHRA